MNEQNNEKKDVGIAKIFPEMDTTRLVYVARMCGELPRDSLQRKKLLDSVIDDLKRRYPLLFRQDCDGER